MISNIRAVQSLYDVTWGRFVFAGAYDWFLRSSEAGGLSSIRQRLVAQAYGNTLEIATGTGLNLPHYTAAVNRLVLTEPYAPMAAQLRKKLAGLKVEAEVLEALAERLPFPDNNFDTVVGTMILCTAQFPEIVLNEIARVLKPGGQFLFLEHIRNVDPAVARIQDLVQPAWYLFGNGCHCNRDSVEVLRKSLLCLDNVDYETIPNAWKIVKSMASGRATKIVQDESACCRQGRDTANSRP